MKKLSVDDKLVWHLVKRSVKPIHKPVDDGVTLPLEGVKALVLPPVVKPVKPLVKTVIKPMALIERPLERDLKRGKMVPQRSLDLHGMRIEAAFERLQQFLQQAQYEGLKLVIVVTGKGLSGAGILKQSVPTWLELPSFRHLVIGYAEAGRFHGRDGALYVRVRKSVK